MKYNFDKQLIIHYEKNRFTNVYKRVINKRENNKYSVVIYYYNNGKKLFVKSRIYFTEEQIEKLIDVYINEFNIKKRISYK